MNPIVHTLGDMTVTFDPRSRSDEFVVIETWEWQVYRWQPADMKDRKVLDLGANIGAFTLWAAAAGASRVRAVEPEPGNFTQLLANLHANPALASQVQVMHVAASPDPSYVHLGEPLSAGSWVDRYPDGTPIANMDLETLLTGLGDDVIVKCDIEGSEYRLFEQASDESLRRVARIAMEYHAPEPGSHPHRDWTPRSWDRMTMRLGLTHDWETNGGDPNHGGLLWAERR